MNRTNCHKSSSVPPWSTYGQRAASTSLLYEEDTAEEEFSPAPPALVTNARSPSLVADGGGGGLPRFQPAVSTDHSEATADTQALLQKCDSIMKAHLSTKNDHTNNNNNNNNSIEGLMVRSEERDNNNHGETTVRTTETPQFCVALTFALLTILLVLVWNHDTWTEASPFWNNGDDDYEEQQRAFLMQAHAILMTLAFSFLTLALLVGRVPFPGHQQSQTTTTTTTATTLVHKVVPTILWVLTGLCTVLGILAILCHSHLLLKATSKDHHQNDDHFRYQEGTSVVPRTSRLEEVMTTNNTTATTTTTTTSLSMGHFATFHSIFGWGVLALLTGQLVVGVRAWYLQNPNHTTVSSVHHLQPALGAGGVLTVVMYATMALTMLLGFQEAETAAGCSDYSALDENNDMAANVGHFGIESGTNTTTAVVVWAMPHASSCLQSHVLGLIVFIMTVCTCLALFDDHQHHVVMGSNNLPSFRNSINLGGVLLQLEDEQEDISMDDDHPREDFPYEHLMDEETVF